MLVKRFGERALEVKVKKRRKIKKILKQLGIDLKNYVILKNGEVVLEEEYVSNNDEIELIPVASGG
ncbi:thiamine biosynthesis protein ThiS [Nanoarchaeota archaeon]|nr:MAG: thiamine biosynthesis protein ThiS [Nanoarchaeota archaeon]